jgi:hypothetical protein
MSPGRSGFSAGYRGNWADNQTFVLEVNEIANREAYDLRLHFMDDRVVLEAKERTHESGIKFEGKIQN